MCPSAEPNCRKETATTWWCNSGRRQRPSLRTSVSSWRRAPAAAAIAPNIPAPAMSDRARHGLPSVEPTDNTACSPQPWLANVRGLRRIKPFLMLVLALLWVPLTSHCRIESVPGFEFLRCSANDHGSSQGTDACEQNGCCAIEDANYQAPRQQEITPIVVVATLRTAMFDPLEQSPPAPVSVGILPAPPPELPTCWLFSLRTALPVRAPSLAS